jgi:hypothetical protein
VLRCAPFCESIGLAKVILADFMSLSRIARTYTHSLTVVFAVGFSCVVIFGICAGIKIHRRADQTPELESRSAEDNHVAQGLRIEEHLGSRKVFSCRIDKLKVVGKKKGFFRLGFWKVARLENVRIDVYLQPPQKKANQAFPPLNAEEAMPEQEERNAAVAMAATQLAAQSHEATIESKLYPDLPALFTRNDKFKRIMPKGVRGVEIDNIEINFCQGGQVRSSLTSDKATIDGQRHAFVFEGHVRILTDNGKTLECRKASWLADARALTTHGAYVLNTQNGVIRGQGFQTDFLLSNVDSERRTTG